MNLPKTYNFFYQKPTKVFDIYTNRCDVNNLSCGKGREYFGANTNHKTKGQNKYMEDESSMTLKEKAIFKMHKCGHFLHHSEETVNLDFLSDEEKENLISILSKCLNNWE